MATQKKKPTKRAQGSKTTGRVLLADGLNLTEWRARAIAAEAELASLRRRVERALADGT